MRRPPHPVVLVARTHWVMSATIVVALAVLYPVARKLPGLEFGPRTYLSAVGIAAVYFTAGTLVWLGWPPGRLLSRICGLIYLARPQLGSHLWDLMNSLEYRAHFEGRSGETKR